MDVDYIQLAIPAFFVLIGLELFVGWLRGERLYRFDDAVTNLGTGLIMQLTSGVLKGLIFGGYLAIYGSWRLFDLDPTRVGVAVACFLGVDFGYYWFHRLSHEVNFLWAGHVVHHQSEDYNLGVALRQSSLQPIFGSVFYWPMALLGFPPALFLAHQAFNTLYQFWLHTQTIGRLGPLEWIFVTPSHHRVHHGRNPLYIDRNHGGTFIVWDRLFGTYQREEEPVVYGVTTPLASWNPVWANIQYWVELFRVARHTSRFGDRVRMFLKPPGWFPAEHGGFQPAPPVDEATPKFDLAHPRAIDGYVLVQFAQLMAGTGALLGYEVLLSRAGLIGGVGLVVWGLANLGGLFEGRAWVLVSEGLRLLILPALALAAIPAPMGWALAAGLALNLPLFAVQVLGVRSFFAGEVRA